MTKHIQKIRITVIRNSNSGDETNTTSAADLVIMLASGRADALSGRFFTIEDDVIGLVERAGAEGLGDLHTLRLRQQ